MQYPGFPPVETARPAPAVTVSGDTQCYPYGNLLYCLAIQGVPAFFTCCEASEPLALSTLLPLRFSSEQCLQLGFLVCIAQKNMSQVLGIAFGAQNVAVQVSYA